MVTVTAISPNTPINGFGVGIGEFLFPTPVELFDGMDIGDFPAVGTVPISQVSTDWEFGRTTSFGSYSLTDRNLDPGTIPNTIEIDGPDGSMRIQDLTQSFGDYLVEGLTIAAVRPGTSNEEGFYRAVFKNNDLFTGSKSDDVLFSFGGKDTLFGRNGNDVINAGAGNDTVSGGNGDDRIIGKNGKDDLSGNNGKDVIFGGKGKDKIDGGGGKDTLLGGGGNDDIKGGKKGDDIEGGKGKDTIAGGGGSDTAKGGAGNDQINGQFGDDDIRGGGGSDKLEGGRGNDIITGGPGSDFFLYRSFDTLIDLGEDVILDFVPGSDVLDFRQSDVFAGDVSIGAHADGTEIVISTANTAVTIVLDGVDPGDVSTDDFLFPVI